MTTKDILQTALAAGDKAAVTDLRAALTIVEEKHAAAARAVADAEAHQKRTAAQVVAAGDENVREMATELARLRDVAETCRLAVVDIQERLAAAVARDSAVAMAERWARTAAICADREQCGREIVDTALKLGKLFSRLFDLQRDAVRAAPRVPHMFGATTGAQPDGLAYRALVAANQGYGGQLFEANNNLGGLTGLVFELKASHGILLEPRADIAAPVAEKAAA